MINATLVVVNGRVQIHYDDPDSIPGLRFRLASSSLDGLSDGSAISTWTGLVNSVDGTQSTSSRRPTKQTVSGHSVARFSTDDALDIALNLTTKSTTYVKYANRSGTNGSFFGGHSMYGGYAATSLTPFQRNAAIFHSDNTGGSIVPSGGTTLNGASRLICAYDYDNDQFEIFINGVSRGTSTTAVAVDTAQVISIGVGYAEFLSGDILEIGCYDSKLTSTQIASLDNYLVATYGA